MTNTLYVGLMVLGAAAAMSLKATGLTLSFGANVGINSGLETCFNATGQCNTGDETWGSQTLSFTLCSGSKCKGNWAVYQISFAFTCFFSTMMFLTCSQTKFSSYAQHGHWFAKIVFIAALLVATAFMSADSLAEFSSVARIVAPFFLLYQLVMFIDFGYRLNDWLLSRDEDNANLLCIGNDSGNLYKKWMLFTTIVTYIGIFVGFGFMYSVFPSQVSYFDEPTEQDVTLACSFNTGITTVTLLFVLLNTGVGMVRKVAPHASILTSAIVSGYCTYYCYGALGSMHYEPCTAAQVLQGCESREECNPSADLENTQQMVLNIVLACAALLLTGWGAGSREQGKGGLGSPARLGAEAKGPGGMTAGVQGSVSAAGVAPPTSATGPDTVTVDVDADPTELSPASFWRYHLVMTLCSIYMSMLLTNWGDSAAADPTRRYNVGYASAWVQVAANWVCSFLYLWTLVVPYLCRHHRDFGVEFDL